MRAITKPQYGHHVIPVVEQVWLLVDRGVARSQGNWGAWRQSVQATMSQLLAQEGLEVHVGGTHTICAPCSSPSHPPSFETTKVWLRISGRVGGNPSDLDPAQGLDFLSPPGASQRFPHHLRGARPGGLPCLKAGREKKQIRQWRAEGHRQVTPVGGTTSQPRGLDPLLQRARLGGGGPHRLDSAQGKRLRSPQSAACTAFWKDLRALEEKYGGVER